MKLYFNSKSLLNCQAQTKLNWSSAEGLILQQTRPVRPGRPWKFFFSAILHQNELKLLMVEIELNYILRNKWNIIFQEGRAWPVSNFPIDINNFFCCQIVQFLSAYKCDVSQLWAP